MPTNPPPPPPQVLLPLAGTPMIEYTLEMLANAKVKEIIVICCWHADQVSDYIKKSRWGTSQVPLVSVVSYPDKKNAGEALAELSRANRVKSDPFVLVSGDVVSNVRLGPALKAHTDRADKNKFMTMLFRKTSAGNPLRNFDDELVVVINEKSKQLLLYETDEGEPEGFPDGEISIAVGGQEGGGDGFFKENPCLQIRKDLLDCHIDICSPAVLDLISDEFFQDLRMDLVKKEVTNREFMHNIYVHELTAPQDYAARVHCLRSYDQVSNDVIKRWLYPLTPDNNWWGSDRSCRFSHGFLYREAKVLVDRSAKIGPCTILGADSVIGEGAFISSSVLGRGVTIGAKASVTGSYVWDGAIIEAGAKIDRALICNGAVIGANATIMRGAVISFGVAVEPNRVVMPFTRLTKADPFVGEEMRWDNGSEDGHSQSLEDSKVANADASAGLGGVTREYTMQEEEDEDEVEETKVPEWIENALNEATGIWKGSLPLVMGSMGCDELERARDHRSWIVMADPDAMHEDSEMGDDSEMSENEFEPSVSGGGSPTEVKMISRLMSPKPTLTNTTIQCASSRRIIRTMPSREMDDLPSAAASLLAGKRPQDFASVALELKGLRSSRTKCTFGDIVAVVFPSMCAFANLSLASSMGIWQGTAGLSHQVGIYALLHHELTKNIMNQEVMLQFSLIQAAELLCLIGPQYSPLAALELSSGDDSLTQTLNARAFASLEIPNVDALLIRYEPLRKCFPLIMKKFVEEDLIDLPGLEAWKAKRAEVQEKHGVDDAMLVIYRDPKITKFVQMLEELLGEEEDDDDDEEEGEEE